MSARRRVMAICVLGLTIVATSCSSIPPNTPKLLGLTNERIENQTAAVTAALQMVLDEANFARGDIESVRDSLVALRTAGGLDEEQTRVIDTAIGELTQIARDLAFGEKIENTPKNTDRIMGEVVASLRLVQEIIGADVDKKQLVDDMIGVLSRTGGKEK